MFLPYMQHAVRSYACYIWRVVTLTFNFAKSVPVTWQTKGPLSSYAHDHYYEFIKQFITVTHNDVHQNLTTNK